MWNEVREQEDIDHLLEIYGNFHDSCIVGLEYMSGASVGRNKSMYFAGPDDRRLDLLLHRQWEPVEVELSFTGVRKFSIVGWNDNYFCDIYGCHLGFHRDLLPGRDDKLIVWSDNSVFSPNNEMSRGLLDSGNSSYIIAQNLSWRLLDR